VEIHLDGRQIAEATVPHIPGALYRHPVLVAGFPRF
jgi:hypothetical protein